MGSAEFLFIAPLSLEPKHVVTSDPFKLRFELKRLVLIIGISFILTIILLIQYHLDQNQDRIAAKIQSLAHLPKGEYLKPASLGYQHLAADLLWLRLIQVNGKRQNTIDEYQWMYHALDVITTLDPQYSYAYEVGGTLLSELAHRVDLSNQILEKGHQANPNVWRIPFQLGYNHFFYMADPGRAADYMSQAARLPGRPAYLSGLATRMYAEANNPEVALEFLAAMWAQTENTFVKAELETRMKELIIERDIQRLEVATVKYKEKARSFPHRIEDLVEAGYILKKPEEPFGGEYLLDNVSGQITSSTHPKRLRVIRPEEAIKPPPQYGWTK